MAKIIVQLAMRAKFHRAVYLNTSIYTTKGVMEVAIAPKILIFNPNCHVSPASAVYIMAHRWNRK